MKLEPQDRANALAPGLTNEWVGYCSGVVYAADFGD